MAVLVILVDLAERVILGSKATSSIVGNHENLIRVFSGVKRVREDL